MAQHTQSPRSSLRNNIMIAFFLAIIVLGVSITAMSHHILQRALADSELPAESIQRIGQQVTQLLTGFTIVGTVIALLVAALLSRTITEPIRRLLAGVDEIGTGNLGAHIDVAGDDELGQLATAFNDMACKLKESHDRLESTVAERTAELTERNEELQTEIAERWRTEEQLRRSEARFAIMADSAQDAILMMDPEGLITFYNKTAETMFGWSAAEVMGRDLHALIMPAKYREAYVHGLARYRQTGEGAAIGKTLELTALRKDGTEFPIEISLASVELDRQQHAIGIVRDITERKRIEQILRDNEQRLQSILNSILAGVLVVDPETHAILDVNEAAADMIGLPRSEIVGKVCHEFVCPAEAGKCPLTDLGQTVHTSERKLIKADGTILPIIKSITEERFQGKACLLESFVGIANQKRVEGELKESLSMLQATLEATADGILVTEVDTGKYKNYNTQYKKLWRVPEEVLATGDSNRVLAWLLSQLKEPESFRETVLTLRAQWERKSSGLLEFKDGTILEYFSEPQYLGDQIVGRVWSFRDVTVQHNTQQKQEHLLQQIAEINEELSHFAYVVSHDLKAPLRGIKLLTEWLCTDYEDQLGDEAQENLRLLQSRVYDRMHNLIEGVLQYSRVGRIQEDEAQIDLNELLPEIIDTIAPPEHIAITVEGALPIIEGETTRITQIFQNLLTNAVKYMDKPEGRIVVAHQDLGDAWQFSVTDNGPGIEERHFDRIFKIFQTLVRRDEFESTGVGLTLVKKIVELYGGKIWLESELACGSTFHFTLPKQHTDAPAARALVGAAADVNA